MCDVDYLNLGLSIPAIRGVQGGRELFVALPNNGVINTFFPTHVEVPDSSGKGFLDVSKVDRIAKYISGKKDGYVLGAIIYATDSDCKFDEALAGSQFGVLRLPLNAKLRTIDGQHRREALRSAVEVLATLAEEHTPLILYVEPSLERRKDMFADINTTSASDPIESVPGSEPFESAAIRLAREHPFLVGRVKSGHRKSALRQNEYNLGLIVDSLKRLFVGATGRVKISSRYRKSDIEFRGLEFFDSLIDAQIDEHHTQTIGSIAGFAPTLTALAGAAWRLRFDEVGPRVNQKSWVASLRQIDFSVTGLTWLESGLSNGRSPTIAARQPQIIAAIEGLVREMSTQNESSLLLPREPSLIKQ